MEKKSQPATLNFKYRYAKPSSRLRIFGNNGSLSKNGIKLNEDEIDYSNTIQAASRDSQLQIVFTPNTPLSAEIKKQLTDNGSLILFITNAKATELKKHINQYGSIIWAEKHRQELLNAGKSEIFATGVCPHCKATIDLSASEITTYIFCPYCESILNRSRKIISNSDIYNICDECQMYDRVRGYTVLFFYFLILFYGYSYSRKFVCDNCATSIAKRTLLLNLIFVLGVPSAIYMWIKAQSGREPYFKDLAKANQLARKGKYQSADEIYDTLFSQYPEHPGILMNKGMGHILGKDMDNGVHFLNRSLKACVNYKPSAHLLYSIQKIVEKNKKA